MKQSNEFSVCIKCYTAQENCATFEVSLFDETDRLLDKKLCPNNQKVYFYVKEKAIYRIKTKVIQSREEITPGAITKWVMLQPDKRTSLVFLFNNYCSFFHKRIVKVDFELTDYFYPKLPIEKGELILWPSMR